MGVCNCSMLWCTLVYVHSSFAIILIRKRELVALLGFSSWCLVMVVWLFLAAPWVYLRFVIVVFPDHTQYFLKIIENIWDELNRCDMGYSDHTVLTESKNFLRVEQLPSELRSALCDVNETSLSCRSKLCGGMHIL